MRWRAVLTTVAAALSLGVGADAPAQASERVFRLAVLAPGDETSWATSPFRAITLPELARLGFVEGRNLAIEARYGPEAKFEAVARELVAGAPDAIVAVSSTATRAAHAATARIPIIMSFSGEDPVAEGFAESLGRPGGNVTGLVMLATELDAKRLDLLAEAVGPARRRIAVLAGPPVMPPGRLVELEAVAARRSLELLVYPVAAPSDYAAAFAAMDAAGAQALAVTSSTVTFRDAAEIASRAVDGRLPSMCEWREMAARGCLLGYGPSLTELRVRTAQYVARIFSGDQPGEMPIEGPTRFEFAINLRTADRLGIKLPEAVLVRAEEVIE